MMEEAGRPEGSFCASTRVGQGPGPGAGEQASWKEGE